MAFRGAVFLGTFCCSTPHSCYPQGPLSKLPPAGLQPKSHHSGPSTAPAGPFWESAPASCGRLATCAWRQTRSTGTAGRRGPLCCASGGNDDSFRRGDTGDAARCRPSREGGGEQGVLPAEAPAAAWHRLPTPCPWGWGDVVATMTMYVCLFHVPLGVGGMSIAAAIFGREQLDPQTKVCGRPSGSP